MASRHPLYILQSLWGMERVRGHEAGWPLEEQLRMIHAAGFDGISAHVYPGAGVERWIDQARELGFVVEGNAFPTSVDDLRPALELAARHGIHHLAIQGDVRPYNAQAALPIVQGWLRLAREHGVVLSIETHRNTLTNDLWQLCELLDLEPALPLLADLSHCVCGQEMNLPVSPRNEAGVQRVLGHANAFHGRVASSQQVQLEIGFEHHRPWVDQFMAWWSQGFALWRKRAREGESLTFTCELGPAPYAITDRDGADRSNRWDDAQHMRRMVRQLWDDHGVHHGDTATAIPAVADPAPV
jgi:hypothetical protein